MQDIFWKTFGGLSKEYYLRQLFFGGLMAAFMIFVVFSGKADIGRYAFILISLGLYPYSRFVYESICNFILGDNILIFNAAIMMFFKLFVIIICFIMAMFIAPVGMLYLYFHHSKHDKIAQEEPENHSETS